MSGHDVPVLIVGGGPVGLAAAICLAEHGVASLLVEQHATTTDHPKATVVNTRTFELLRQWGLEEAVRSGGLPPEKSRFIVWATSLTGFELGRLDLAQRSDGSSASTAAELAGSTSPTFTGICPQDVYEPILRRRAEAAPCTRVRFATELVAFEERGDGVVARVRSRADGREETVRARWMLACDGAASPVREGLGVAMEGPDDIGCLLNVYFHADLTRFVAGRESALYWIVNPDAAGVFIALNNVDRWLFNTPIAREPDAARRFTPDVCAAKVRRAVGDPDLRIDVRSIDPWIMRSQVAARYRVGRVFLLGDAAHRFPPTGGFGMNTGVQDAHNLAWKIAGVVAGWAGEALLDTYEEERRPVARFNADQSYENARRMPAPPGGDGKQNPLACIEEDSAEGAALRELVAAGIAGTREHFSASGQAKGFRYASAAITPDGSTEPSRSTVERYVPSAAPGCVAPHAWVRRDGRLLSLLDLFGRGFVLLAGPSGAPWREAACEIAATGLPLDVQAMGVDLLPEELDAEAWCASYDVARDGAVLVRPDGHVAWRRRAFDRDAAADLRLACARAVGKAPITAGAATPAV